MWYKGLLRTLFCSAILVSATNSWSAEIHGRSSTQFQWYNDIFTEKKVTEFSEYINLSVTKLDKDDKLSIQGYGRATQDVRNGDGLNGRLYYLYADYSDLYDKVDLRFGRQFVNYAAGSALIDGGQVELKKVGPVAFSIMGGRNVFFDLTGEGTKSRDFALGAAAYLTGIKKVDAELSYFMKLDKDGVARDQLGASFKEYLFNSVKIYANTRYDIPTETFSEVLAGAKYFPTADLVLTGEWYQSYPTFDATSIYSVFAVDRYREGVARADYTVNDMLSVNAGFNKQYYGEDADANVLEVGCRIRPIEQVKLELNYDHRNGYGGKLNGGIAEITYEPIKPLEIATGIHYDVYERDRVTGEETARKYWLGAKYKLAKNMSATVRIEDDVNARYSNDWQGRTSFNYDF